ncbi:MAG: hypothetical protein ACSHXZ_09455 [Gammaproteobacteria bacterium]
MNHIIHRALISSLCLLCATTTQAQIVTTEPPETTVFPEPAEYCFPQTSLHREFTGTGFNLRLNYHLIVPNTDLAKAGDVFVGARFKDRPNELWLLSGNTWRNAEDKVGNWPSAYFRFDDQLRPIVPISFSYDPEVASTYGDGEIWIGYGLRTNRNPTQEAFQESFDEMMRKQRFSLLWEIKAANTPFPGELHAESAQICLKATQMERTVYKAL